MTNLYNILRDMFETSNILLHLLLFGMLSLFPMTQWRIQDLTLGC